MDRILLIGTGGTIACVKDENIHLDKAFKILEYMHFDDVEFECVSPFCILSENIDFNNWDSLIEYISDVDFDEYKGVIVLHGSDTLSFTGALLANAFYDKPIVLVASDKPLEDKSANGFKNFEMAVDYIQKGIDRVYISYDSISQVEGKPPLDNPVFKRKNILVITPYVNINYDSFKLDDVDAVLHTMYHSATAPKNVNAFIKKCKAFDIPFYFVTDNNSADYQSAVGFDNIIFNSTVESAYARLLLS